MSSLASSKREALNKGECMERLVIEGCSGEVRRMDAVGNLTHFVCMCLAELRGQITVRKE